MDVHNAAPTSPLVTVDVVDALNHASAAVRESVTELQLRIERLCTELDRISQPFAARVSALAGALATHALDLGRALEGIAWT